MSTLCQLDNSPLAGTSSNKPSRTVHHELYVEMSVSSSSSSSCLHLLGGHFFLYHLIFSKIFLCCFFFFHVLCIEMSVSSSSPPSPFLLIFVFMVFVRFLLGRSSFFFLPSV